MNAKFYFLLTFLTLGFLASAQDQKPKVTLTPDGVPKMHLLISEHDFGIINQGTKPEFVFIFVNEGSVPLVINEVSTPCNCTSPYYSKEAVAPGESGEIRIQFNSTGKIGNFVKTVTVKFNSDQSPEFLTIKGNIVVP